MEKNYCVDAHISPNNKYHIGITRQVPIRRWHGGSGYRNQPKFYNAIKKYGWDNFQHIILFENLTENEACKLEKQLIIKYNSIDNGYNQTNGGTCGYFFNHKESTKQHLSELKKGIPLSPEHKEKACKQLIKNREKRKRGVYCVETSETFSSVKEASDTYDLYAGHITECCKGTRKTSGKLHWKYWEVDDGEMGRIRTK